MILAIDTSTRLLSIALVDGDIILGEFSWRSLNQHNTQLAAMVQYLLAAADTGAEQLDGVAVAKGPGSFTGVRIGMAAAKGLAMAHQLPFYAVSTLDIAAHTLPPIFADGIPTIYAALPAGRGRLIAGQYQLMDAAIYHPIGDPMLLTWVELVTYLQMTHAEQPLWLVGELDDVVRVDDAPLSSSVRLVPASFRLHRAATLGIIARGYAPDDPTTSAPFYIKEP